MIIGNVTLKATWVDESPIGRSEIVYTAKCDCGCEYQNSFIEYHNDPVKLKMFQHETATKQINHWLATDRHGSQLRPSPIQQSL